MPLVSVPRTAAVTVAFAAGLRLLLGSQPVHDQTTSSYDSFRPGEPTRSTRVLYSRFAADVAADVAAPEPGIPILILIWTVMTIPSLWLAIAQRGRRQQR